MEDSKPEKWTIDHKVPVIQLASLVIVLVGYAYVGVQAIGKIDSRLTFIEAKSETHDKIFDRISQERDGTRDRLIRLEEKLVNQTEIIQRIDRRLENLRRVDLNIMPDELKR